MAYGRRKRVTDLLRAAPIERGRSSSPPDADVTPGGAELIAAAVQAL